MFNAFAAILDWRFDPQWGTVGEWVAGVGGLFVGVIALYYAHQANKREADLREEVRQDRLDADWRRQLDQVGLVNAWSTGAEYVDVDERLATRDRYGNDDHLVPYQGARWFYVDVHVSNRTQTPVTSVKVFPESRVSRKLAEACRESEDGRTVSLWSFTLITGLAGVDADKLNVEDDSWSFEPCLNAQHVPPMSLLDAMAGARARVILHEAFWLDSEDDALAQYDAEVLREHVPPVGALSFRDANGALWLKAFDGMELLVRRVGGPGSGTG